MKKVYFFENLQKLKEEKRKVWIFHQISDPETIASHIFRTAVLSWILGERSGMDVEKVIKMALIHDFCQVFTFDEMLHDPFIPRQVLREKDFAKIKKIMQKLPELSLNQKERKAQKKNIRRTASFKKLISELPADIKKEFGSLWTEMQSRGSREARFICQAERAENLLQAFEYWSEGGKIPMENWIYWVETIFDNPVFWDFKNSLEKKFIKKEKNRKGEMDKVVDFLVDIGRLKRKERVKWNLRKVSRTEKMAEHCFSEAIATWIFSKGRSIDSKKAIKMALAHEFAEIFLKKSLSCNYLFPNLREGAIKFSKKENAFIKEMQRIFLPKTLPIFSIKKKEGNFKNALKKERKSIEKLTDGLAKKTKEEIIDLWEKFSKGLNREAKFVQQIDILDNLIQASAYFRKDKNFPMQPWWSELGEKIEDPLLIDFIKLMYKKVHSER